MGGLVDDGDVPEFGIAVAVGCGCRATVMAAFG